MPAHRKRVLLALDVGLHVVVVAFLLGPASDMLGDVGPVSEAVHLCPLDQGELLVCAPVFVEDWERVRRDDAVVVRRSMRTE